MTNSEGNSRGAPLYSIFPTMALPLAILFTKYFHVFLLTSGEEFSPARKMRKDCPTHRKKLARPS
ncbi:hypothetical protein [Pseudomonas alkylphenolica]|uniref:hypothetical protein n=1 Tax=Pseudomonas alkylphenolica TaxID=237609 RepID=UPI000FEBDFEF|nr:hypothetical protein [Pseudomonas alkylphenolica]